MNLKRLLTAPYRALRMARLYGPLYPFEYVLRNLRWKRDTWLVRRAYFTGQRRHPVSPVGGDEREFSAELARYSAAKLERLKTEYAGKHRDRAGLRFLFRRGQEGGTQFFFINDLIQCLEHTGVPVRSYAAGEPLAAVLEDFRPTVFIAGDYVLDSELMQAESVLLRDWRDRHGLVRFYLPFYLSPVKAREATPSEMARIAVHRSGLGGDAFLGYFEDVFWTELWRPWHDSGLNYHRITFGANPLRHFPLAVARDLDWGTVTTNADLGERAALTIRYMNRIMREYHGQIHGYQWGPGIEPLPAGEIARFACRVKVSPNPAPLSNILHPIDCGAKVHELLAMGVFQLCSETAAMRQYYSPDEVVSFRTPEEFNQKFDHYVRRPEERMLSVKKGMDRVFAENTYFHRLDRIVALLDQHPELFGR